MNPYKIITVTCVDCGITETAAYKVLVEKGWRMRSNYSRCRECTKKRSSGDGK